MHRAIRRHWERLNGESLARFMRGVPEGPIGGALRWSPPYSRFAVGRVVVMDDRFTRVRVAIPAEEIERLAAKMEAAWPHIPTQREKERPT